MNSEIIEYNIERSEGNLIKVIGVGGAGSNAVKCMQKNGIKDVSFAICNTDAQALNDSGIPERVQIGLTLTQGLGAGNKPALGKLAAQESEQDILRLIEDSTRMVFVTAGMGGGTGTGAAPVVAKICRDRGLLTVGIVTLPFRSEGKKRQNQAFVGIKEMEEYVDCLIIINSERIRDMYGDLVMSKAFAKADALLLIAAKSIAEIVTVTGLVNVDFADVESVMRNSGVANMGSAEAHGENRALNAIQAAIDSPLLTHNNILGASNVLISVTSSEGDSEITMNELDAISEYIQEKAGHTADIIWGNNYDNTLGDKIRVTVIVTGFEQNNFPNQAPIKKIINLDEPTVISSESIKSQTSATRKTEQNKIDFETEPDSFAMAYNSVRSRDNHSEAPFEEQYGTEVSAYTRKQMNITSKAIPDSKDPSRMSLTKNNNGETIFKKENPFLHDNVD